MKISFPLAGLLICGLLAFGLAPTALAAPETRTLRHDKSFGDHGLAVPRERALTYDVNNAVSFASDGGFGMFGTLPRAVYFLRLDRDGHRVRSFGRNGKFTFPVGGSSYADKEAVGAEFDRHGRVLLIFYDRKSSKNRSGKLAGRLIRLTRAGKIDRSFGTRGTVWLGSAVKQQILVRDDGMILVNSETRLTALTTHGKIDKRFGVNGRSTPANCTTDEFEGGWDELGPFQPKGMLRAVKRCEESGRASVAVLLDRTGQEVPLKTFKLFPGADDADVYFRSPPNRNGAVVGYTDSYNGPTQSERIVRVLGDGSLDRTFGTGGMLRLRDAVPKIATMDVPAFRFSQIPNGLTYAYRVDDNAVGDRLGISGGILSKSGKLLARTPAQYLDMRIWAGSAIVNPYQPRALFFTGDTWKGPGLKRIIWR